jgi:CRISPR/Cas system CSM-associated protein Csm3 (group 7 of RAMP superfamily)
LARLGMLKDRQGWPYVPASAFKGRLRHAVEQVARSLELRPPICATHQQMCREALCPVCQLFGSPWAAGRLRFTNLHLSGPPELVKIKQQESNPRTTQRMSVAINRRRRVAEDAMLFSTELLWPGVALQFSGTLAGEISQAQAGLLLAGLNLLPALGRGKTGGLGWLAATAEFTDRPDWTAETLRQAVQAEMARPALP